MSFTTDQTLDSAGGSGLNNLASTVAIYAGGTWGLMAGEDLNITISNRVSVGEFFTKMANIDGHQSVAGGGLALNGFVVGDTRTITFDATNDTYTINVVPEPSSALHAAFGCGFLTFRRRRA